LTRRFGRALGFSGGKDLFELKQAYEAWQFSLGQVEKVDEQIALQLGRMKGDRASVKAGAC
jgi:hypothetical protein